MTLDIYKIDGTLSGEKLNLADDIFGIEPNDHAIYLSVKSFLANQRQGTSKAKERGEVSGGGKKPWRQKGTGRARAGTSRSPVWSGGGTVFGPHPRSYCFSLPKKARKAAICSVLTAKLKNDKLTILDKIELEAPKTKLFAGLINGLGFANEKSLFLIPEKDPDLTRASRNIYRTLVLPTEGMNVYDLLRFERLAILKDAIPRLTERLS